MFNEDPFSLIESRALEGERRPTYWCMPAILSSLFFLCFSLFLSQCSLLRYDFLLVITITVIMSPSVHGKGPFYSACRDQFLLFQPLITFVWYVCPCQPLLIRQSFSHYHLLVLVVPPPITRQRRLFCLFICRGPPTYYGVDAFSLYPLWYAPSGSHSSLLLLGSMLS